ncbi:hypothetical protein AXF42_Ash000746 [Apostasia shenzhenica]|uniref:Uncharacterized protein n=1 Tax=Apostasia shenzhenica TaxID=1088818 RepID=A0A2I0AH99_9ASPA|nr:hypothetical protein AXF42_Ash000746 [Apostasia shenzhenica]
MNTFLANFPALLQQRRPLPLALPLEGPLRPPSVERLELPPEEASTHTVAESHPSSGLPDGYNLLVCHNGGVSASRLQNPQGQRLRWPHRLDPAREVIRLLR